MKEHIIKEFVSNVEYCLTPNPGEPGYLSNPETRWFAYLRIYNEAKPALLGNYPEFVEQLEIIMDNFKYTRNNLDMLRTLCNHIRHLANRYITSPSSAPLTPEQLLEAIHAGVPPIVARVSGKRFLASIVYQLNRLIELEKRQGHD